MGIRKKTLFSLIVFAVLGYIFLVALLTLLQSRLIYFPSKVVQYTPSTIGLKFTDIQISTEDGEKLAGWYIPSKDLKGVVLFLHGNAGNIGNRLDSIRIFNQLGLDVFIFDYRGYGDSSGKPSEEGTYKDAEAAWSYLVKERGVPPEKMVLFGRSLGGALAIKLAEDCRPAALIVESTFTSVPDLVSDIYPFLPIRRLVRYKYDSVKALKKIKSPILVIHSRDEEIIPFKHGEKIFQIAPEPKEMLEIKGSHNEGFILSGEDYILGINNFLKSVF